MINQRNGILEFGEPCEFWLDPTARKLMHRGEVLPLQSRTFDILLVLVESSGQVVSKDEIMRRVWGDRIVEEGNLTQHIYHLRRSLRDSGHQQNLIVTSSGGYLFSAEIRMVGKGDHDSGEPPAERDPLEARTSSRGTRLSQSISRLWPVPLLLIVLGLLIGGGLLLQRDGQTENRQAPPLGRSRLFVAMKGIEISPAWSPDGTQVAFTSNGGDYDSSVICIRSIEGGPPQFLTNSPRRELYPRWSPDGRSLAFLREAEQSRQRYDLIIKPLDGSAERRIAQVWHGLDWSPDGKFLAVSDSAGSGMPTVIYLQSVTGQERRAVTNDPLGGSIFENGARFSPDGRMIAFVRWSQNLSGDLYVVQLDRREARQLTFDRKAITGLEWTPDGREILFISDRSGNPRLWRIDLQGGAPRQINLDLDVESFSLSPD
ncbi:MAG: winged helix-turn-helix domain-containing protein, partial [Blastocatellia bacterium]